MDAIEFHQRSGQLKKSKLEKPREIVIGRNASVAFPTHATSTGDVLIYGNFNGVCGNVLVNERGMRDLDGESIVEDVFVENLSLIVDTLSPRKSTKLHIVASKETLEYFKRLSYWICDTFNNVDTGVRKRILNNRINIIDTDGVYDETYGLYGTNPEFKKMCDKSGIGKVVSNRILEMLDKETNGMKFNTIVTNPPYDGSLHLDIFGKLLDRLDENGRLIIVEPATWLINIRKNGRANKYDAIKKRIKGHVKSVKIENLNKGFNTGLYVPFSITHIDMGNTFDHIEFECCGEYREVKSIYDCNLIGSYDTIWSILNKAQKFGDMMDKHTTNKDEGIGVWYAKYDDITPFGIDPAEGIVNLGRGGASKNDNNYVKLAIGEYGYNYVQTSFHRIVGITQSVPKKLKPGSNYTNPKYSDKNADCVYGTKSELENWKHFIFNNKLPLFINIVLTIDQHNNSKEFLPWLVDKQYTDEEINKLFGFTQEEIDLIDATLKKFERNSPWFKRYMCGPSATP